VITHNIVTVEFMVASIHFLFGVFTQTQESFVDSYRLVSTFAILSWVLVWLVFFLVAASTSRNRERLIALSLLPIAGRGDFGVSIQTTSRFILPSWGYSNIGLHQWGSAVIS